MWSRHDGPLALKRALDTFDREEAARLVRSFIAALHRGGEPYREGSARNVLSLLRLKRQFDLLSDAADALIESGNATLRIRQDYAQALLDRGMLTAARAVLDDLIVETGRDVQRGLVREKRAETAAVNAQARGLLGRLNKQWYVNAGAPGPERNAAALVQAISAYWDVYAEDPSDPERRWHAVNAVALAMRATKERVAVKLDFDPLKLAVDLVAAVRAADEDGVLRLWDHAIALEASLAVGDSGSALTWATRYVAHNDVDAFQVSSTRRQLGEVWGLSSRVSPGAELIAVLDAKLLELDGGSVTLDSTASRGDHLTLATLHRVFEAGFVHGNSLRLGVDRARSVARIGQDSLTGVGTGVLVRGSDLNEGLGAELFVLTNAHVVSRERGFGALLASHARVSFPFAGPQEDSFSTGVEAVIWQSNLVDLDASLLRLRNPPRHLAPCPMSVSSGAPNQGERVFIAATHSASLFNSRYSTTA